jgi:hypothetical protein
VQLPLLSLLNKLIEAARGQVSGALPASISTPVESSFEAVPSLSSEDLDNLKQKVNTTVTVKLISSDGR